MTLFDDDTKKTRDERFADAIVGFWDTRFAQAEKQRLAGKRDAGNRGMVTGGKHFALMSALIEDVIVDAGLPPRKVTRTLPSWYHPNKNHDGVVMHKGQVVAILEYKSQVGSFGNNQNNRIEEMIGQSRDIYLATKNGLHGTDRKLASWFGYLVIVEDHEGSRGPARIKGVNKAFPIDPTFEGTSYIERYALALSRMRAEGDLGASCLVATDKATKSYWFPDETLSFEAFAAALTGRIIEALGALGR